MGLQDGVIWAPRVKNCQCFSWILVPCYCPGTAYRMSIHGMVRANAENGGVWVLSAPEMLSIHIADHARRLAQVFSTRGCRCEAPCSLGPHSPAHSTQLHRVGSLPCSLPCRQKPWGRGCRRNGLSLDGVVHPLPSTLCYFLDTWIDILPEEFCQSSDLSILEMLQTYLMVNMPYSDLNLLVHMLLMELQQESCESERQDEEISGRRLRP